MRIPAVLVTLVSLSVIVGSAVVVLDKHSPPHLSVSVADVPGYIYYDRDYTLSIEYANHGGSISGPVELVAQLPETFALAEHIDEPARRGERLTWTLDGLTAGETGSIPISVRGVLPDDLTNAVYDLPGYEGHTAFVEGFDLGVTLTAGQAEATALATADTGTVVATGTIIIRKDRIPDSADNTVTFSFTETPDIPSCTVGPLFDDGTNTGNEVTCMDVPVGEYVVTEANPGSEYGSSVSCVSNENGDGTGDTTSTNGLTATIDLDVGETVTCTFTNQVLNLLTVRKVCAPVDDPGQFNLQVFDTSTQQPISTAVPLGCGTQNNLNGNLVGTLRVVETAGTNTDLADYVTTFGEDCAHDGTVVVEPGDRLTCVVTNARIGTLTLIKETLPGPDPTDFEFSVDAGTCDGALFLDTDDSDLTYPDREECEVGSGTFSVDELKVDGWATSVSCGGTGIIDTTPVEDQITIGIDIELDGGADATCTFTNARTGTIIIRKDATPDSPNQTETFAFIETPDIPGCTVGPLYDDGTNTGNEVTCSNVPVGQYSVTENNPAPDYAFGSVNCETTETAGDTTVEDNPSRTAIIDLDQDETVTCTFFNRYLNSLTVEKHCSPEDDAGQFNFQILDSNQQPVHGVSGVDCETDFGIGGFDADTFQVVETAGTGTDLADYETTFSGACDVNGFVTVGARDRLTCIVSNVRIGTFTVIKETLPGPDSTDFEFITNLGNCHAGTLLLDTDASDATYEDRLVCQLGAGSYSVEELTQAGWATSVSCAGTGIVATPFTQDDGSGVGVDFGLDDGADATCTFTNARTGTIVVQKDVEGGTDSQNFGFTDNVPAPCVIGTLDDDPSSPTPDSVTCSNVPIGSHTVTEDVLANWDLVSITCTSSLTEPDGTTVSVATRTATIDLDPGETVTCTFLNREDEDPPDDDPDGEITIIKQTIPATSSPAFSFSSAKLGAFSLAHGESKTFFGLDGGTYVVTENVPTGWDLVSIECPRADVSVSGSAVTIDLPDNGDVVCFFTNRPELTVDQPDEDPTPVATATKTPPKSTATATPTKTPTPVAAVDVITPPSTGDGGVVTDTATWLGVGLLALFSGAVAVGLRLAGSVARR